MSAKPALQFSGEPGKHLNPRTVYSNDSLQLTKYKHYFSLSCKYKKISDLINQAKPENKYKKSHHSGSD